MQKGDRGMAYIVDTSSRQEINLHPETVEEEVLQNLWMLYSSLECGVPLDRGLGLAAGYTDRPPGVAEALLQAEIYDKTEKYEPRAEVVNISFADTSGKDYTGGILKPVVEVEINGSDGDTDGDGIW